MIESNRDLFVEELAELYAIESKLEEIQSGLAGDATDEELEAFYMGHSEATTEQLDRLEAVFDSIQVEPERRPSSRLDGLLEERENFAGDTTDPRLHDLVDTETGLAIERLEITKLETLLALANRLNLDEKVTGPLRRNKQEAENAVDQLQAISIV